MRRAFFVGLCLLGGASHGFAAEATSEEAQRLVGLFHQYLGTPQAGEPDFVTVEPQGDAYRVTLDLPELARPFEPLGLAIDEAKLSLAVEPLPDGTWRVSDVGMPSPLTARFGETKVTYRWDGVTIDGVFDPALGAFTHWDNTIASTNTSSKGPSAQSEMQAGEQVIKGSATDDGNGAADVTMQLTGQDLTMHQTVTSPDISPDVAAMFDLSYDVNGIEGDVSVDSLEAAKLNALWAYGMSQRNASSHDNQEIRELLTGLLPIYRHLQESGTLHGLRISTAMGEFGVQEASGSLALPGIIPDGEADIALKLAGGSYPQELVPAWAQRFVPDEVQLAFNVSGFNLDAPARRLISQLDVNASPPLDKATLADALALLTPEGNARLTLAPSSITSSLLTLRLGGEMTLDAAAPTGSLEITAVGLGDAIAAVSGAAGDPAATQVLGILGLAQALGKPTSDGATYFLIEMKEDGSVSVNGQTMGQAPGKSL